MHTGEKRFICKICTQTFNNRYDMKRHMSNVHHSETTTSDTCTQETSEDSRKYFDWNIIYFSINHLKHHK